MNNILVLLGLLEVYIHYKYERFWALVFVLPLEFVSSNQFLCQENSLKHLYLI